jgi:hypothetical protein
MKFTVTVTVKVLFRFLFFIKPGQQKRIPNAKKKPSKHPPDQKKEKK